MFFQTNFEIFLNKIDEKIWFYFDFSVNDDDEENADETSNEILEDVLKQLDKLGTEKRNQILKKLRGSIANKDNKDDQQESTSPKSQKLTTNKNSESDQDEVEILDLNEPKMGTYKRKRSEFL